MVLPPPAGLGDRRAAVPGTAAAAPAGRAGQRPTKSAGLGRPGSGSRIHRRQRNAVGLRRITGGPAGRAIGAGRAHPELRRCRVVGADHHHHSGLRRHVPRHRDGPSRGGAADDRRISLVGAITASVATWIVHGSRPRRTNSKLPPWRTSKRCRRNSPRSLRCGGATPLRPAGRRRLNSVPDPDRDVADRNAGVGGDALAGASSTAARSAASVTALISGTAMTQRLFSGRMSISKHWPATGRSTRWERALRCGRVEKPRVL